MNDILNHSVSIYIITFKKKKHVINYNKNIMYDFEIKKEFTLIPHISSNIL